MKNVLDYYDLHKLGYWKIETVGNGEKAQQIFDYNEGNFDAGREMLERFLSTLGPGKYQIKIKEGLNKHAGQSTLAFEIERNRNRQEQSMSYPPQPQGQVFTHDQIQQMLRDAKTEGYAAGKEAATVEGRLNRIEERLLGYESFVDTLNTIKKEYEKLNDEDESNDSDALKNIGEAMSKLPDFLSGIKKLKTAAA